MLFSARFKKLADHLQKVMDFEKRLDLVELKSTELLRQVKEKEKVLNKLVAEKTTAFPWLAEAIAEYHFYTEQIIALYLKNKSHPAPNTAEIIAIKSKENKVLRKEAKLSQYSVRYYEKLFPWITNFIDINLEDELIRLRSPQNSELKEDDDPIKQWVSDGEWHKLPSVERNQRALDRYLDSKNKSNWIIGRDYERYIGYLYEQQGYNVDYSGIKNGLDDLGRDLICTKSDGVTIIQCKHWANYKEIHENHINQLYGTVVKYYIDKEKLSTNDKHLRLFSDLKHQYNIKAILITSTQLSETAIDFADALGIEYIQHKPLERYPIIKCNIGSRGELIYHLPFDQQYDNTLINKPGEFYASTVKEAEDRGFRRAYRWSGGKNAHNIL